MNFEIEAKGQRSLYHSFDIPYSTDVEFYALSVRLVSNDIRHRDIQLSLSSLPTVYGLDAFADKDENKNTFISNILYLDGNVKGNFTLHIQGLKAGNQEFIKGYIRVFAASKETENYDTYSNIFKLENGCTCPLPQHITRSQWGQRFNLSQEIYTPPAAITDVSHLIVHHSAGTNQSSNWPAVVASIFDFHVNTNGWQDVGYNWLIDPNGVIYEGRGGGDNVRGAHMCGYNNNTMGICVLGNFDLIEPSDSSIEALERLLAWKSCKENIGPTGRGDIVSHFGNMLNISGHQDGCRPGHTACPGQFFVPKLAKLREDTQKYLDDNCGELTHTESSRTSADVNIFPNPASNTLCFSEKIDGLVTLIDVVGQKSTHIPSQNCIELVLLTQGIYYAHFIIDGESFYKKLVILR